jgi:hypothetical protein
LAESGGRFLSVPNQHNGFTIEMRRLRDKKWRRSAGETEQNNWEKEWLQSGQVPQRLPPWAK